MKKVLISLCFLVLCSVSFAGPKEDLVGYYKVDISSIKKVYDEQMATLPEEQQAMMKAQLDSMLKVFGNMVVQFTEKETSAWMMNQPKQTRAYAIEKTEGNVLTIKDEHSTTNFVVNKDSIEVVAEGGNMKFLKITEKEAKEMIAKAEAEMKKKEAQPVEEEAPAQGGGME